MAIDMSVNPNQRVINRRLLKLADFLEALPRGKFDYEDWFSAKSKKPNGEFCGTRACAAGWAAQMPCFKRLGLRLEISKDGYEGQYSGYVENRYAVFGIEASEELFMPAPGEGKFTAKQVAKKIRKYVAAHPTGKQAELR